MSQSSLLPAAFVALATGALPAAAGAVDCHPDTGVSPCFEADALRLPAGPARFAGFAAPEAVPAGQAAFTAGASFVLRPVLLRAASPEIGGRDIDVVEHELGLTLATAVGLGRGLELGAALPMALSRSGSGVEGVTAQSAPALVSTAARDPRFGVAYTPWPRDGARPYGVKARLELSLPLGDEDALAGYAGPALLPALSAELALGRLALGGELSARFGDAVDFASTRQGSELFAAVGVAFGVLDRGLLDASLEGWLRQSLDQTPEAGARQVSTSGPAAEWLLGLRSSHGPYSIFAGGGAGIPLATETHTTSSGERSTTVSAPTAPAARALLLLSYTPRPEQ